jgi:hypothetical protein
MLFFEEKTYFLSTQNNVDRRNPRPYYGTNVLEFKNNLWGIGNHAGGIEYGCRTGPSGNIGWRNRFLESLKVKNTGSDICHLSDPSLFS